MQKQGLSKTDINILMYLGIGSIILVGILLLIFRMHDNQIRITKIQNCQFKGKVIGKEYKRGEYFLKVRLDNTTMRDTIIKVNEWKEIYELSNINDSIYKNKNDSKIFSRRNKVDYRFELKD